MHEPDQLFRNLGNGAFEDITARAGRALALSEVGRGTAVGDIDNDGDPDVLVGNNNGRARLLINVVGNRKHWIGLHLSSGEHDVIGARVGVTSSDGAVRWRRARADGSYASANDPRVLVGLGSASQVSGVEVIWPDGRRERWANVPVDRWTTLGKGTGQ